jgi:hypothetical protein
VIGRGGGLTEPEQSEDGGLIFGGQHQRRRLDGIHPRPRTDWRNLNDWTISMSTRSRLAASGLALATCAAIGLSGISPAAADPTPTTPTTPASSPSSAGSPAHLAAIKARAAAAISRRLASLNQTIPQVTANSVITAADKATLLATLNGDVSGLTTLGQKIAADTTVAAATTDYQEIFLGYRVYALALPQVLYAEAADAITSTVLPRLRDADTTLAALLAGVDSGKDTPAVQAAMTDLGQQIAAATTATNGISATVLAFTPAQWDANHALLHGPRQTLAGATKNVAKAKTDIVTVLDALQ